MRTSLLPFSPPSIGDEEISEVIDTLRSDWITTGPKVARFEREFASAVEAPAALALNSGTAALHVALAALGVGPGDAVITSPLTFCSGVHVIEQVGALPILVDVEPDTLNLDPVRVRETLDRWSRKAHPPARIKALMPVHLYGHPCDLDALLEIAREHQLAIVEDAAHALPARHRGRIIGSLAGTAEVPVLTCFSFYATKNLTTCEGGMLTGPASLTDEARIWSLHGMSRDAWKRYSAEGSWYYEVVRPGYKYNMADLQAAVGLAQLAKLGSFHTRRAAIARQYNQAFAGVPELETPAERPEVDHAWHIYCLRLNASLLDCSRSQFIEELKQQNICASVHFIPVHMHPYYRDRYGFSPDDFPVAHRAYRRMISLPIYPRMSDRDTADVIEAVLDVVERHRAPASVSAHQPVTVS